MKLNVILITYNQELYIRQTIESILMQKTGFDFDIIVADDNSPDRTREIIEEYAKNSEIKFHFLPKVDNLGFVKNYQRAFSACQAEYVAIIEGDDFWTSSEHLEQHVRFLDKYTDCSMSFNRHIRLFQDREGKLQEEIFDWEDKTDYQLIQTEDMIFINRIGNLSCCVFRNQLIQQLKPEIFEIDFADWLLGMIMGQYGSLAYQKNVTSAYRIHEDGQWTRMSGVDRDKSILNTIDEYDKFLDYRYTDRFQQLKKWKTINVYGDQSLRGRIKQITPSFLKDLYNKLR